MKDKKKKDKTRQSSSGGSAPGTPVPGERGSSSIGTPLTPGELKVHLSCSKPIEMVYRISRKYPLKHNTILYSPITLFKSVTKKLTTKGSSGGKGDGGTDSGNTSRASTPVSDRSVKVEWDVAKLIIYYEY